MFATSRVAIRVSALALSLNQHSCLGRNARETPFASQKTLSGRRVGVWHANNVLMQQNKASPTSRLRSSSALVCHGRHGVDRPGLYSLKKPWCPLDWGYGRRSISSISTIILQTLVLIPSRLLFGLAMMSSTRLLTLVGLLVAASAIDATPVSPLEARASSCNADNLLRRFRDTRYSDDATSFCQTFIDAYTHTTVTVTTVASA